MKKLIAILIVCCACCVAAFAAKDAVEDYARLSKLSSQRLMELGRQYYTKHKPSQALTCFSIISDRYRPGMSVAEASLCIRALNNSGCVYHYYYYDYTLSYESFTKGLSICDEVGNEEMRPTLLVNLAELLDVYAARYSSQQMADQARDIADQCIQSAYQTRNWELMVAAFYNLTNLNYTIDLSRYHFIMEKEIPDSVDNLRFVRLQYQGIAALQRKHYDEARHLFEQQLKVIDVEEQPERNEMAALMNIAKTYELQDQLPQAAAMMERALAVAENAEAADFEVICCNTLSDYYKKMGETEKSREYYVRYLENKEVIQSGRLASVGEMNYIQQLKREEAKANSLAERQQRQVLLLILGGVVLLIVGISALLLYRKNRELNERNKSLFEKNQQVMRAEEAEQLLRRDYEEQLRRYQEEQQQLRQFMAERVEEMAERREELGVRSYELGVRSEELGVLSPLRSESVPSGRARSEEFGVKGYDKTEQRPNDQTTKQPNDQQKYSRSNLNDEQKSTLIYRIQEVLNSADAICQTDFSLAKLAKLVGSNTAYVSQVINEKYGQTFTNVVGNYRVKEACRRMNDTENYGHMTIEAISEGVGFKSRSTFVNAFKRQIGLTPSEYIRMAAE